MGAEPVIGVDVVVKTGSEPTAVLGQRNASMSAKRDMIEVTVKTDWPAKKFKPGWHDATIDCDGALIAGAAGGVASLYTALMAGTELDVTVTIGSSGEKLVGKGFWESQGGEAPQDKEGTWKGTIHVNGALTPTVGGGT